MVTPDPNARPHLVAVQRGITAAQGSDNPPVPELSGFVAAIQRYEVDGHPICVRLTHDPDAHHLVIELHRVILDQYLLAEGLEPDR